MARLLAIVIIGLAAVAAIPYDPDLTKQDHDHYQNIQGPDGTPHLIDASLRSDDTEARYNPDRQNVYHLFTRDNPTVSQPLLIGNAGLLGLTNYNHLRRTVILLHTWLDSATADFITVMVPAFLAAEDVNVIVVDWSVGAGTINYIAAVFNTVASGESVARFIDWLNGATGVGPEMYHIVGHGFGGHQAGIVGRNVEGSIGYITALDPANAGWILNSNRFRSSDGAYTEVIHTNAGIIGYLGSLGNVDFYPNGGVSMPGCGSPECDHARSYFYLAETLVSGGFPGRRCSTYVTAMIGSCILPGSSRMGGLVPKTGSSGVFHLQTNAEPPFSRG